MQRATLHSRGAAYSSRLTSTVAQARIEPMKEFFPSVLFVVVVVVLPVAVQSAPVAPVKYAARELTIPVADGCGINRYRDSRGICRRKYEFTRHRGKPQLYGACGGVDSHRVCNLYGQCWMVCD